ncbi:surface protease GP63 [Trypanosoma cruzi]|nr:surface protease GP63 [Trypanosoma cruzi]
MAIDGLVSCRRALEMDREPSDQLMDFWQGPAADLPDADRDNNRPQHIPPSTLRARLHMAVHEADIFARATQPLLERRATQQKQRLLRFQLCRIYGRDASTRNVRSAARGITRSAVCH